MGNVLIIKYKYVTPVKTGVQGKLDNYWILASARIMCSEVI